MPRRNRAILKPRMFGSPLNPLVYLVRNAAKSVPMVGVIALAVMLIAWIVALMNSIPDSVKAVYSYSQYSLGVTPRGDPAMTPKLVETFRNECPVPIERIIVCRGSSAVVRSIVGEWPFVVLAFNQDDMDYFLDKHFVTGIEGRKPTVGRPEALVSEPVARNLRLKIGDVLLGPDKSDDYSPQEVRIVGIAKTSEWMMLTDLEYHKANHFPPIDVFLVLAKDRATQAELDDWALERFKGDRAKLFAYRELEENTNEMFSTLYQILNVVIVTLVAVIALMIGMLMNIYQSQRLVEFGLLQCIGYARKVLLKRSLKEALWVTVAGWQSGVLIAHAMLRIAYAVLMEPRAWALNTMDPKAFAYTLVVPVAIFAVGSFTVLNRFRKFDPVSIVERRLV